MNCLYVFLFCFKKRQAFVVCSFKSFDFYLFDKNNSICAREVINKTYIFSETTGKKRSFMMFNWKVTIYKQKITYTKSTN